MEAYLEGEEPSLEDLHRCIRKGTLTMAFFPTYCGSAFKDKGIQMVLDAVVAYLPDPTEVHAQPEVDEAGNETGEFAVERLMHHYVHLPLKLWMIVLVH